MKSPRITVNHLGHGFTLLELVVVFLLIGLFSGISLVNWSRTSAEERIKAATRESASWLDEVRRVAIQKGKACNIMIDNSTSNLSLSNDDNEDQLCEVTDFRALSLKSSAAKSDDLIICSANLLGADPATFNLPCTNIQTTTTKLTFTPRGTSSTGLLLKLHLPQSNADRCIAVMAPLGQIRSGKATSTGCDFTTSF